MRKLETAASVTMMLIILNQLNLEESAPLQAVTSNKYYHPSLTELRLFFFN